MKSNEWIINNQHYTSSNPFILIKERYFKMIKSDSFSDIMSVFLIYCNDNNIPWSMPMLFNKSENTLEEQQLLEESQRVISEYNNWK